MIDVCLCYALTEDGYTLCPTVDNRQKARVGTPTSRTNRRDGQRNMRKRRERYTESVEENSS